MHLHIPCLALAAPSLCLEPSGDELRSPGFLCPVIKVPLRWGWGPGVSAIAAAAVTALGTDLWVGRVPCPAGCAGATGLPSHVRTALWLRAAGAR